MVEIEAPRTLLRQALQSLGAPVAERPALLLLSEATFRDAVAHVGARRVAGKWPALAAAVVFHVLRARGPPPLVARVRQFGARHNFTQRDFRQMLLAASPASPTCDRDAALKASFWDLVARLQLPAPITLAVDHVLVHFRGAFARYTPRVAAGAMVLAGVVAMGAEKWWTASLIARLGGAGVTSIRNALLGAAGRLRKGLPGRLWGMAQPLREVFFAGRSDLITQVSPWGKLACRKCEFSAHTRAQLGRHMRDAHGERLNRRQAAKRRPSFPAPPSPPRPRLVARESLLQHPTRARILAHLADTPGATLAGLKRALRAGSHVIQWHLAVLLEHQLVQQVPFQNARLFALPGVPPPDVIQGFLARHALNAEILAALGPAACSLTTLATRVGRPKATVLYHLGILAKLGLVERSGAGRPQYRAKPSFGDPVDST